MQETQQNGKKYLTGADLVIRALIDENVDTIFGYPGGQVLAIYDALEAHKKQIKHILTAHEQGAAHAADGYARATGKVGVVLATSGPGAANLVTGIATACLDSSPLVAITGNVPTAQIGRDSFQELDIADITMPITKHNYIVKDIKDLPRILHEAFDIARSGRQGPVLVDIPRDIQSAKIAVSDLADGERNQTRFHHHPMQTKSLYGIDDAAKLIKSAKRPIIYCGGGTVSAGAGELVMRLSEKIHAPAGCSLMGLSAIPTAFPANLGLTGMHGHDYATEAVRSADVIIAIGARFTDRATGSRGELVGSARIVQFDIDPAEIDKNVTDAAYVIGDLRASLEALLDTLPDTPSSDEEWYKSALERKKSTDTTITEDGGWLTPRGVINEVNRMTSGMPIITDVGQHQMWAAQYCEITGERGFITSGGLGTMGFGMGAAIGASLALGKRPAVLYTGDGSFGMDLIELATAVSYNVPLIVVVMNNSSLGMVKQWQKMLYRRTSQSELHRETDFVKVAKAFGAKGMRAMNRGELKEALNEAMELVNKRKPIPFVIDCVIDPEEKVVPTCLG